MTVGYYDIPHSLKWFLSSMSPRAFGSSRLPRRGLAVRRQRLLAFLRK